LFLLTCLSLCVLPRGSRAQGEYDAGLDQHLVPRGSDGNSCEGHVISCLAITVVPLQFVSLQFVSLQFVSLQFVSLQFVSLQFVSLQFVSLQFVSLQFVSRNTCCSILAALTRYCYLLLLNPGETSRKRVVVPCCSILAA